jgi:membrane fusion protein (multidrug efflux system)
VEIKRKMELHLPAHKHASQVITADAMIVATRPLSSDIEIPGTIMANETTEIHPEVSGRVGEIKCKRRNIRRQGRDARQIIRW